MVDRYMTHQTTRTTAIIVSIMETMIKTNRITSFSNEVSLVFGSFVRAAIRPKTVLSPMATTNPTHEPDTQ